MSSCSLLERSFRATSLTERLGLAFARERENPTSLLRGAWSGEPGARHPQRRATRVDARSASRPIAGLLTLELDGSDCIGEDAVRKRFGASPESVRPQPARAPGSPLYWVYSQEGCTLSFGFSRREPACLVSVTLDSIPSS